MKKRITRKLEQIVNNLILDIDEDSFIIETYQWDEFTKATIVARDISWKNVCGKYKSYFDSIEDFKLDLNLFMFEVKSLEVKLVLKHLYGAVTETEVIYNLVTQTNKTVHDIAVDIINNFNYKVL